MNLFIPVHMFIVMNQHLSNVSHVADGFVHSELYKVFGLMLFVIPFILEEHVEKSP